VLPELPQPARLAQALAPSHVCLEEHFLQKGTRHGSMIAFLVIHNPAEGTDPHKLDKAWTGLIAEMEKARLLGVVRLNESAFRIDLSIASHVMARLMSAAVTGGFTYSLVITQEENIITGPPASDEWISPVDPLQ
jgi:hypothetical protein